MLFKGIFIVLKILFIEIPTELVEQRRAKKYKDWKEDIPKLPEELKTPPDLWQGFCLHKDSFAFNPGLDDGVWWCRDCNAAFKKE